MYRIVFLDIDETILNSQGQLDAKLLGTIQEVQKKGILVALATGRSLEGAKIYGGQLGVSTFVTYNGGYVISHDQIVHDIKIPSKLAYNLCNKTNELNGIFIHFSYSSSLSNHAPPEIEYLLPKAIPSTVADTNHDAHRLVLYLEANHRASLQKEINNAAIFDEGDRLEIFPKGSKWSGISPLIKQLGISPKEVIAIGNGTNDIEMLEEAGLGIAMGNASELVKKSANWVTADNDHHGVTLALRKIFKLNINELIF
ncbi:hypothetical protein CU633_12655 [Bacillus sp. V3-13]|uniref:HAD family hydrolase n=1 Tax=Bacillus sp. V3-13 TaxID=2053728 RepID=UPI000C76DC7C|nr:HAD family hydrolase [Bacillus sp. V3-13]PLR77058.1 hypothetical protein CU633_12655 [Bacillus sp. V3-13]